jgi:hypothetical protein
MRLKNDVDNSFHVNNQNGMIRTSNEGGNDGGGGSVLDPVAR